MISDKKNTGKAWGIVGEFYYLCTQEQKYISTRNEIYRQHICQG